MKLLYYMLTLFTILITIIGVQLFENDSFLVIRSILTHYQVIDGDTLSIPLYASQISPLLLDSDVDRTRIIGDDIAFDVTLARIQQHHQETYLNRTYFQYELFLELPHFFETMFIENVYLEITTINHQHLINIGKLNIIPYESTVSHEWTSIYGIRHLETMTLDSIIIETHDDFHIKMLEGMDYEVIQHETHLEIQIKTHDTIILQPILIIQSNNGYEMIAGMTFISSKRMLIQTEGYHHVYAVY